MAKYQPITIGAKFGRWTVIRSHLPGGDGKALVECECGNRKRIKAYVVSG